MNSLRFSGLPLVLLACLTSSAMAGGFIKPEPLVTPPPRLADELIARPGTAYAQLQVNEFGFVTEATIVQSSDPRLNEPILEALRRWKFEPATEAGRSVSCYVVQPVRIANGVIYTQPEARGDRDPSVRHTVTPELPRELQTIEGYVTARVDVDAKGVVTRAAIIDSTHPELDRYVLEAVAKWSFTPAVKDGKAAPSRVAVPFHFRPNPQALPRHVAAVEELAPDSGPVPTRRVTPDLPDSVIGQDATAEVEFVVDQYGNVVDPTLVASSHEEFGASALKAIKRWRFRPARQNGEPVATRVRQQFTMHQQVLVDDHVLADRAPKVRKTVAPEVPAALRGVEGKVEVWLAIDEAGNVTDAEVRDATYAEFAAPAVEAARQWKFAAAVRDGKPVASAVVVPFLFGR